MKTFAGLLALGFLCLAVPQGHAALNCSQSVGGTGSLGGTEGFFWCTEDDVGQATYTWSSNPPGGVLEGGSPILWLVFDEVRIHDATSPTYNQYMQQHPNEAHPWFGYYRCGWLQGGERGQYALPVETVTVEVYYSPGDGRNHTDTAEVPCGAAQQKYNDKLALWYEWEMNVAFYMALLYPGWYINSCLYSGTPFSCVDGTPWDAYGVTMFMYGWYNTYYW